MYIYLIDDLQIQHYVSQSVLSNQSVAIPHPGVALNPQYIDSKQALAHIPFRVQERHHRIPDLRTLREC